MLNITDKPPTSLLINNKNYKIETDFKVWCKISESFKMLDFESEENADNNVKILNETFESIFANVPNEPVIDILNAVLEFLKGYPQAPTTGTSSKDDVLSFKYDLSYIILAIRNQSGIDLSHQAGTNCHWWDFLIEVKSLEERHYISKLISLRGYEGEDKEMLKIKAENALPKKLTPAQEKLARDIDELFYNT